jgi:hypothetical protein
MPKAPTGLPVAANQDSTNLFRSRFWWLLGWAILAKLIYIGGYGRSGSTLLEYLLTASAAIVACGEVARHFERFGRIKTCTCGRPMEDCPLWGTFQHSSGKLAGWNHEKLTLALRAHLSDDYAAMVDSSKTAWGSFLTPFRLRKQLGEDFLLIHLVRDPRAVCWSAIRTPQRHKDTRLTSAPTVRCLRTAFGWTIANIACEIFGWLHPHYYTRVRYEALARSPQTVLWGLLEKVSVHAPLTIEPSLDNRHQLYGNSMRFRPLLLSDVREDLAWKSEMPKGMRWLATGLCWPLGVPYGYVGR